MLSSNSSREPLGEGAPSGGGGQLGQDAAGRRGPGRSNRARLGGSRTLPRWQTTGCWQADRGPPGRRRAERVFSWAPPTFQAFLSLSTTVLYPSPSFFFFFHAQWADWWVSRIPEKGVSHHLFSGFSTLEHENLA